MMSAKQWVQRTQCRWNYGKCGQVWRDLCAQRHRHKRILGGPAQPRVKATSKSTVKRTGTKSDQRRMDLKRLLSKVNYRIHTDAIKHAPGTGGTWLRRERTAPCFGITSNETKPGMVLLVAIYINSLCGIRYFHQTAKGRPNPTHATAQLT